MSENTHSLRDPLPLQEAPPLLLNLAASGWRQRTPWLREPLLHFVLLGAALFAVDRVLSSSADDPHVIVVTAAVNQEARDLFKAARGREPNADEQAALRRTWLDNEVLYREGLALQVDRGDSAIRERVIFKRSEEHTSELQSL